MRHRLPDLFNCVLEEVLGELDWKGKGIKIDGEHLNNLRFADDMALIGESHEELEEMAVELTKRSKEAGPALNSLKAKIITNFETNTETGLFKTDNLMNGSLSGQKKTYLKVNYYPR